MRFPSRRSVSAVLLGVFACSCVPDTKYRRSALVPPIHALAWDGRTTDRGHLRVEAAYTHTNVWTNPVPLVGDSALFVPQSLLEGVAAIGLTRGFELGARYAFAAYEWSQPSAFGTAPLPGNPTLSGFGPEARGTIRIGDDGAFGIGIAGNYLFYGIPTSEWVRDNTCTPSPTCIYGWTGYGTTYRLVSTDVKTKAVVNIGIYPSYEFGGGKYGHVFGGVSLHDSFKNDGFSDNPSGQAAEGAGLVPVLGAGYGIHIDYFRASAMLDYALTSMNSPVYYDSLSFFVALGVDLPLWGAGPPDDGLSPPAPPRR